MTERLTAYAAFWPYYLQEHSRVATRAWHYVGTALVLVCAGLGIVSSPWWFVAMPFAGYGFAWASHFFIEKTNRRPLPTPAGR